jgi:signal transduction histidine kinase
VYASERALVVNRFAQSPYVDTPLLRGVAVAALLAAPLRSEGRGLGVLLFTDAREPYRFSQVHAEEATILATTAAAGLENARLVAALREESSKLSEYSRTLEASNRSLAVATGELQAVNREMEDLLYIASHDLRAPLINIQGFAYEARRELERVMETLPPDARRALADVAESLRFVDSSSGKMDTLISALLDVSRIASRDLAIEPVDLGALVHRISDSFRFVLQERGITLTLQPLPTVIADPVRIEQVFSNLIDNAIKYMGDGRREIEVGCLREATAARYYVRDTGMGITAAELPKVFRLFRRGRAIGVPGEGIGLTMVRKIIERHGGRIWIESQEGQGTTVWFTIGERPVVD